MYVSLQFTTGWEIADPICTFVFSIIVLFTTITVLKDIFYVLMEGKSDALFVDYISHFEMTKKLDNLTQNVELVSAHERVDFE